MPTRIYSDVTRVTPAEPRSTIEERLQSLGYSSKAPVVTAFDPPNSSESVLRISS